MRIKQHLRRVSEAPAADGAKLVHLQWRKVYFYQEKFQSRGLRFLRIHSLSVCSDCRENFSHLPAPINMTLPKKIKKESTGMINQSITFKILPLRSRWQHGLPLTPVTRRPAHLRFTFYDWKCLMKNRKCSRVSAHHAHFFFFMMNHCYIGTVVSLWNEPVRYFQFVSHRAIDNCLFPQNECRHWRNELRAKNEASQTKVMKAPFVSPA